MLALTGYAVLNGGDEDTDEPSKDGSSASVSASPGPSATYAPPDDWTEPNAWAALPRGKRSDDRGSQVGFPHTTEGAVAAAAALNTVSIEGGRDAVDEQLRIYHSYVSRADQSDAHAEEIELAAIQTDKSLHKQMGVPVGEALPGGAYMRSSVIGYKVVNAADDEVSVWLLSRAAQKGGEMAKESVDYTRILNAVVWEDGDWKLSGAATQRAMDEAQTDEPEIVAPGDAAFNSAGWTAIREAS
ncbi:hypothetical protein [Streptomyces salinarius]|uniref:hypothetical protein n=1 Tax=Streptomyces salinarius TaxID=2762598 RepID=UPI001C97A6E6|nr:hypothetical protein [Streptomyces salinarius]